MGKSIDKLKCGGAKKGFAKGGKKSSNNFFAGALVAGEVAAGTAAAGTAAGATAAGTAATGMTAGEALGLAEQASSGGLGEALRSPFIGIGEWQTRNEDKHLKYLQDNPNKNPYDTIRKIQEDRAAADRVSHPLRSALSFGIGEKAKREKRERKAREIEDQWKEGINDSVISQHRSSGYKDGGKIKGKGGPKSDDIKLKTGDGSFIVPAENSQAGMELGKTYLGWNDKTQADRNNGGSQINVSDGEVLFTPKEVGVLKYHNIDLMKLAPNAEPGHSFDEGGWVYDSENDRVVSRSGDRGYDKHGGEYSRNTEGVLERDSDKSIYGKSIYKEHRVRSKGVEGIKDAIGSGVEKIKDVFDGSDDTKEGDNEAFQRKWYDFAPELAGALQLAGGAYGLQQAGQKPDMNVSRTLEKLSGEVRRLAQFGYEPAVINALNNQIDKASRDARNNLSGGSPIQRQAEIQNILSTTIDKKAGLTFANAAEKSRKWADVLKVDTLKAGQEFDINKINIEDWYKNQEVFADMLSAGISNVVGARQLKDEQDVIRKIGGTWPDFSRG